MPFIGNGEAYVTGEVPERALKRLNGPREDYSRIVQGFVRAVVVLWAACGGVMTVLNTSRSVPLFAVGIGIFVSAFAFDMLWHVFNPRARNRATRSSYCYMLRLFTPVDVAFRLVMTPEVIAACDDKDVKQAVDQFLDWYVRQPFAWSETELITREGRPALSELRYKLDTGPTGVAAALPGDAKAALSEHVEHMLVELRTGYRDELQIAVNEVLDKLEELGGELRYQNGQLATLAAKEG